MYKVSLERGVCFSSSHGFSKVTICVMIFLHIVSEGPTSASFSNTPVRDNNCDYFSLMYDVVPHALCKSGHAIPSSYVS